MQMGADYEGDQVTLECPNCRASSHVMRTWRVPQPESTPSPEPEAAEINEAPREDEPATPSRDRPEPDEFMSPEEAFPWWPVPSHLDEALSSTPQSASAYHSNVRLADGRVGSLADPGSYGNLVGAQWLEEAVSKVQKPPTMMQRSSPLQVGGVGKGAQLCAEDCCLPISLTRTDGSVSAGTYTSPVVTQSACPALLGLRALEQNRAILDLSKKQLHFMGPGEPTLILPPGSESFQLELAMSGHLLLPCTSSTPAVAGDHQLFIDKPGEAYQVTVPPGGQLAGLEQSCKEKCECFEWSSAAEVFVSVAKALQSAQPEGSQPRFSEDKGFSFCLGAYTHGGQSGITRVTHACPWLASLAAKLLRSKDPDCVFTSIMVLVDSESPTHIDRYNKGRNTVLALELPTQGGGLWVELLKGDVISGPVCIRQVDAKQVAGPGEYRKPDKSGSLPPQNQPTRSAFDRQCPARPLPSSIKRGRPGVQSSSLKVVPLFPS